MQHCIRFRRSLSWYVISKVLTLLHLFLAFVFFKIQCYYIDVANQTFLTRKIPKVTALIFITLSKGT